MKPIFAILLAVTLGLAARAEETNGVAVKADMVVPRIGTLEATNYIDREVTVTGRVVQVSVRPSVTFLNLDKPFPDSPFTVVIFHGRSQFGGDANLLKGHAIEVRGKIKNFKDKPEIALENTNQLVIVGVTNMAVFLKAPAVNAPTNTVPANQVTNFPDVM